MSTLVCKNTYLSMYKYLVLYAKIPTITILNAYFNYLKCLSYDKAPTSVCNKACYGIQKQLF